MTRSTKPVIEVHPMNQVPSHDGNIRTHQRSNDPSAGVHNRLLQIVEGLNACGQSSACHAYLFPTNKVKLHCLPCLLVEQKECAFRVSTYSQNHGTKCKNVPAFYSWYCKYLVANNLQPPFGSVPEEFQHLLSPTIVQPNSNLKKNSLPIDHHAPPLPRNENTSQQVDNTIMATRDRHPTFLSDLTTSISKLIEQKMDEYSFNLTHEDRRLSLVEASKDNAQNTTNADDDVRIIDSSAMNNTKEMSSDNAHNSVDGVDTVVHSSLPNATNKRATNKRTTKESVVPLRRRGQADPVSFRLLQQPPVYPND